MDISRKKKNLILIGVNLLAFLIQIVKWKVLVMEPNISIKVWVWLIPFILLINLVMLSKEKKVQLIHSLLFLATGAIIAFTVAVLFKDAHRFILVEYLWLFLALIGIVVHYSKSKTDIYSKS